MIGARIFYAVYVLVTRVLGLLPIEALVAVGRWSGMVAWYVAPSYRRLVKSNLRLVFGDSMSPMRAEKMGREHFARLFSNMLAGVRMARMEPRQVFERVQIEGREHLEGVLKQNRGLVAVLGHLGNWELLAQVSPEVFGVSAGSIYQNLRNPFIDASILSLRKRQGLRLFARKEGFFGALEMLRHGGVVGVLADQHAGDSGGWISFFGRLASTSPLPAMMALRSGAALVSVAMVTLPKGRWRLVISVPEEPVSKDPETVSVQVNRILESQIQASPEDWLWSHNRWKTPQPNFLLSRTKRPICTEGLTKKFRLVVRSTNWLGDAVMTVPAIRAIRKSRPDIELTVLTLEKLAGFWRSVPGVDCVLEIPRQGGIRNVARLLGVGGYDAIVLFPNSLRVGLEAWLAGIPRRVGYAGHTRRWFLNQIVEKRQGHEAVPEHHVYHYLRLVEAIGAPCLPRSDWAFERVSAKPSAGEGNRGLRLAVCPGAEYGPAKRWFPDRFAAVMRQISSRYQCEWNLVGVKKDEAIGGEIERLFSGGGLRNWIGRTSLEELLEVLRGCDLLLTNDTGTMHLAGMLGVPVVAIFGSTEPLATGPIGEGHTCLQHRVPCGPCFLRECPLDFACMNKVGVEEVVCAVEGTIRRLIG